MFGKEANLRIEQIYNHYGKLIFSIAYKKVNNYHWAEDITQETIKKMIEYPCKIKELEGNELRNYIARIALNTALDYLKKINKNNLALTYLEDLPEQEQDITDNINIEEFIITKDSVEKIKEEIRRLDGKYRDPLILHNFYGYTIPEVSNLLNVPERTIKHRINKARKLLREVLRTGDVNNEQ